MNGVLLFLVIFATAALISIAAITILNTFAFPRLRPRLLTGTPPRVSVMIPARNEAAVIGDTLRRLLAQDYPDFEILVLDDDSSDGTGEIAQTIAEQDSRLRVLHGQPLPDGWMGKNWACHQMAEAATGEILVFTDADVRWTPSALRAVVADMTRTGVGMVTVWPTQETITWPERLVVPMMALAVIGYLPVVGTHYTTIGAFAAACGQCMAWRRGVYQNVGGHAAVHDNVLEDVTLARMTMQRGTRIRMADGAGVIGCRMYSGWPSVRDGYAKNILAGYGNSVPLLVLGAVFHWLIFLIPWLWLAFGWVLPDLPGWPLWPLALIALGLGVRLLTAAVSRQRLTDGLLMPVSVLLMTAIAARSIRWHYTGGPHWKGRTIKQAASAAEPITEDEPWTTRTQPR